MPSIEWIFGGNQENRDEHLLGLLSKGLRKNSQFPNFWILTVSKRRGRFLTKAWEKAFPQGFWKPPIFLFNEWVGHLFQKLQVIGTVAGNKRLVLDAEKNVCVESALLTLRTDLEYFSKVLRSPNDLKYLPGLVAGLKEVFSYLKTNLIKTDLVERIILNDQGEANAKDHDLTLLFHCFENQLEKMGLIDQEDQFYFLLNATISDFPENFFPDTLVIDHPGFLSHLEERLLVHWLPQFSKIIIALDNELEPKMLLSELAVGKHRYFSTLRGLLKFTLDGDRFEHQFKRVDSKSGISRNVPQTVLSHHHRTAEVQWMCREIKTLALSGVNLADIHVSFPKIDSYLSIIYEIFPQYGVPFSITRGLTLDSSPLAIVIRSILKIPQEYSRESIFRFFSSTLVTFRENFSETLFEEFLKENQIGAQSSIMSEEEIIARFHAYVEEQRAQGFDGFHFDVASLDRYARSANISGGADVINDWLIPLDRVYFRARLRAQALDAENLEDLKRRYFLILRQVYLLGQAKKHFDRFLMATNGKEILDLLRHYIQFFGIERNLVARLENLPLLAERDRYFLLRRDMQSLDSVLGVLDDVLGAITLAENLDQNFGETPLHFVERHMGRLISEKRIVDPLEDQRVQVTESLELRNVSFEYLFFGGLTSHDFPRRQSRDFLLPENLHVRFREVDAAAESQYVFGSVIKNTASHLYFSFPRMESGFEGEKLLEPSYILEDIFNQISDEPLLSQQEQKNILSKVELEIEVASHVPFGTVVTNSSFQGLLGKLANPEKVRKMMEVELKRAANTDFSEYDGMVGPLEKNVDPSGMGYYLPKVLSESGLNHFAKCPQHYFFQRLLHLEPLDEITEDVERSEFGSYVHEILEAFLNQWFAQKETTIDESNFEKALAIMLQVGQVILQKQDKAIEYVLWDHKKERLLQGLDAVKSVGREGILRKFLNFELQKSKTHFVPHQAERKFGYEQPLRVGKLQFRGKIDRLDVIKTEPNGVPKGFLFFDYKTGKVPSSKDIFRGLNFQIPLYMWALRQESPSAPVLGAFLNLHDQQEITLANVMGTPAAKEQDNLLKGLPFKKADSRQSAPWLDRLFLSYAEKIQSNIEAGRFHYAFTDVICKSCTFSGVCRRNPERLLYLGQNSENNYVPENNTLLYSNLKTFSKTLVKMQQKIEEKKEKKNLKFGHQEILLPDEIHVAWEKLAKEWQEIFRDEFFATLNEWGSLVDRSHS